MTKYESEIHVVARPIDEAYAKFSDLNNLAAIKEKLNDPAFAEKMSQELDEEKQEQARKMIDGMTFDTDTMSISSPLGDVMLRIIERDAPKLVKMEAENTPIPLNMWIQLVPIDESSCKIRVTIGAEVNFLMKAAVSGPLKKAADGVARMLALV
ncbi:MAG: hypothetical protein IJM84_00320 [Bacteroidaceae bacterium]|uniref:SRPBCC family protein n=1 Tax=Pseudoprevotella muciniphila TaxID=2133944 RepID=A0A5P8E670_9BACT|nr:hypothetical protein [Pseudoprevotella muciniphila]MBQ7056373.1 hypothetical protein [Bacteroidaceae bacterium]MBQ7664295.1 hypothetical protein [Bacteroidaceae bacterium]QFQ12539.1 hypothetical protein C7Y71_005660 [Pseudoprevotella muciniphila]